jgi:S1-C subfamily serine protease
MNRHALALGTAGLLLVASGAGGAAVATHLLDSAQVGAAGSGAGLTPSTPTVRSAPSLPSVPRWSAGGRAATSPTGQVSDASAAQSSGLVEISSQLVDGTSAGTGMILDADGTVVTNHHVVEGATSIEVTDVSTGRGYAATYVGGNATTDVAVLRLKDASGLTPVRLSGTPAAVGDDITAVGDAGGDGGSLTAATGTVAALHDDITVDGSEGYGGSGGSRLTDLILMDAYVIPGDSGGAVLDSTGRVVGMNVAASSGSAQVTGYAIPIATVERVVQQIESGDTGHGVKLGYDGYLGVALAPDVSAPLVAGVVEGGGAARAGIGAGDTITRVDGQAVGTAQALQRAIAAHAPGDRVVVSWTTAAGSRRSASVTLGTAPIA